MVGLGVGFELKVEPGPDPGSVADDDLVGALAGAGFLSGALFVLALADELWQLAPGTLLNVKSVSSRVCFFGLGCVLSSAFCLFLCEVELVPGLRLGLGLGPRRESEREWEPEMTLELELELLMFVVVRVLLQVEVGDEVLTEPVATLTTDELALKPELGGKLVTEV